MKIVAVSGSPRVSSFTEKILNAFLAGIGEGPEVVKCYPSRMRFGPCLGCWDCWTKTKGVCRQKDEMQSALPAIEKADLIILANPVYVDGFPSPVKKLLDRLIPLAKGAMYVDQEGHTRHPQRNPKAKKAILISTCGFPEPDNFDPLRIHFQAICKNTGWEPAGFIGICAAGANAAPPIAKKLKLVKEAGLAFREQGRVPEYLEQEILKEAFNRDLYRAFATACFEGKPFEIIKGLFRAFFPH
jgi:putative NADPH-quinone reductase